METNQLIQLQCCSIKYDKMDNNLIVRLDKILRGIENFYYSDFWVDRFKRRIDEEGMPFDPIELSVIQGLTSQLVDDTQFRLFTENDNKKGVSNNRDMIALNTNIRCDQQTDSHIENVIMHELGHRQYNDRMFNTIIRVNDRIMKNLSPKNLVTEEDYKYFTDHNEIRNRIIPIIKEMYDNNWSINQVYYNSRNLRSDDIFKIYDKEVIIAWLKDIL